MASTFKYNRVGTETSAYNRFTYKLCPFFNANVARAAQLGHGLKRIDSTDKESIIKQREL